MLILKGVQDVIRDTRIFDPASEFACEIPRISTNLRLSCVTLPPLAPRHGYTNVQSDKTFFTVLDDSSGVAPSKENT